MVSSAYAPPALNYTLPFLLFCGIFPLLQFIGFGVLLGAPMSVKHQITMFNLLETVSTWANLDVLIFLFLILIFELPAVTEEMTSSSTPNFADLVLHILPFEKSFFNSRLYFLSGFWILFACVLIEKLVLFLISGVILLAISQRAKEYNPLLFSPSARFLFFDSVFTWQTTRGVVNICERCGLVERQRSESESLLYVDSVE